MWKLKEMEVADPDWKMEKGKSKKKEKEKKVMKCS